LRAQVKNRLEVIDRLATKADMQPKDIAVLLSKNKGGQKKDK
jgi:hypothetical protein